LLVRILPRLCSYSTPDVMTLAKAAEPSLLAGLLVDARGERLTPSHAVKVAAPERLIAKGMATPGLIAQVLVSKYGDHMPLHMVWNVALTAPPANSAAGQTPRRPQYGCAVRLHRSILSSTASEPDRQRKSTDTRRHAQRDWDRGESGPHRQWQKGPAAPA
jgi:hypothetical protein